jgi:cyclophilin family peptidyl-prolyl cis-trans isomerase
MKRIFLLSLAVLGIACLPVRAANPVVVMETSLGTIKIELFEDKSPITVKNFLSYVDDKFYDGTVFHRVIPDFMVQAGGFEPGMKQKKTKDPIKNESGNGLSNTAGTLAMARTNDPNSATSQFFINVGDNSRLDKFGGGYCVFGKVIDGMDVVNKIKAVKTGTKKQKIEVDGKEVEVPHQNVPVDDVIIKSVKRADK